MPVKIHQQGVVFSPEGALVNSQGCNPWEAIATAQDTFHAGVKIPGVAPLAIDQRPFGAEDR